MGIFYRRPLMTCFGCYIITAAVLYCFPSQVGNVLAFLLAASLPAMIVFIVMSRKKAHRLTAAVIFTAVIFSAVAAASSFIYYDVFMGKYESDAGKDKTLEALVLDTEVDTGYLTSHSIMLRSIDGERTIGKAKLMLGYHSAFHAGDVIRIKAVGIPLSEAVTERAYVGALHAKGYVAAFSVENEDDSYSEKLGEENNLLTIFSGFNEKLDRVISDGVGGEAGKLASAVFLGNREGLSDTTLRDFRRTGVFHLLAISGVHISVVAAFAGFLLSLTGLGKRQRGIILIPLLFGYWLLTGCSVTALRAVLMSGAVFIGFMMKRPADPATVLFSVCGGIMFFSPGSVADIGFWMTFLATLGIITAAPYITKILKRNQKESKLKYAIKTVGRFAISALLVTLAANFALLFVMWYEFGEISVIAPLTNLLVGMAMSAVIAAAPVYLILCGVPWLASPVGWFIRKASSYILGVTGALSEKRYAVVSLRYDFAGVIVTVFSISILVLLVVRLSKLKWLTIVPPIAAVMAFAVCLGIYIPVHADEMSMTYLRRGEREMIVAVGSGKAFICDVSDGSYTNLYYAAEEARRLCATETEVLMLTHYHDKYLVSLRTFFGRNTVRSIWVPKPLNESEYRVLEGICRLAEEFKVVPVVYRDGESLKIFGKGSIETFPRETLDRSAQPAVGFVIKYGRELIAYVGSSYLETKSAYVAREIASGCGTLILGTHGPNIAKDYIVPIGESTSLVIFSDEDTKERAVLPADYDGDTDFLASPERRNMVFNANR